MGGFAQSSRWRFYFSKAQMYKDRNLLRIFAARMKFSDRDIATPYLCLWSIFFLSFIPKWSRIRLQFNKHQNEGVRPRLWPPPRWWRYSSRFVSAGISGIADFVFSAWASPKTTGGIADVSRLIPVKPEHLAPAWHPTQTSERTARSWSNVLGIHRIKAGFSVWRMMIDVFFMPEPDALFRF